ncbi:hypothetical protein PIB30_023098 [Stylosanthes scabra]|uniref:Uncharacterized protein n=1 Tax=Stylosanthes scabra TaxID=79078 RepID=A0ABU6Z6T6_9FABA|nr:hypothetical protein [Stylosanthes scabra]
MEIDNPSSVEEETVIILENSDICDGLVRYSKSLIGRLMADRSFSVDTIELTLLSIWRQLNGFKVIDHGSNNFQFFFGVFFPFYGALWLLLWLLLLKCQAVGQVVSFSSPSAKCCIQRGQGFETPHELQEKNLLINPLHLRATAAPVWMRRRCPSIDVARSPLLWRRICSCAAGPVPPVQFLMPIEFVLLRVNGSSPASRSGDDKGGENSYN